MIDYDSRRTGNWFSDTGSNPVSSIFQKALKLRVFPLNTWVSGLFCMFGTSLENDEKNHTIGVFATRMQHESHTESFSKCFLIFLV